MIRQVSDFMITPCVTVKSLMGLLKAKELFFSNKQGCFPVVEDGQVQGVLTWRDILDANPNRIVADAMSAQFAYADPDMPFWRAKEMVEKNNLAALLIQERNNLAGLVTPAVIEQELGKHTDLLTNLYKTDYLYFHALELMASEQEISIIFADINNFGLINKQYGHNIGDLILKEFSALLQLYMPPESCLCRFGGDEFVILMSSTREVAASFANNLQETVSENSFSCDIPVTMAAGVATASKSNDRTLSHGRRLDSLINMASLASTAAKQHNGDRTTTSNTLERDSAGASA